MTWLRLDDLCTYPWKLWNTDFRLVVINSFSKKYIKMYHTTIFVTELKLTFDDLTYVLRPSLVLDIHSIHQQVNSVCKNNLKTCITLLYLFVFQRWPFVSWPWPHPFNVSFKRLRYTFQTITSEFRFERWPKKCAASLCFFIFESWPFTTWPWPDLLLSTIL